MFSTFLSRNQHSKSQIYPSRACEVDICFFAYMHINRWTSTVHFLLYMLPTKLHKTLHVIPESHKRISVFAHLQIIKCAYVDVHTMTVREGLALKHTRTQTHRPQQAHRQTITSTARQGLQATVSVCSLSFLFNVVFRDENSKKAWYTRRLVKSYVCSASCKII